MIAGPAARSVGRPVGRRPVLTKGGGAFDPTTLTTLALYDPAKQSSFWTDTAGTIPVSADNQLFARMDDRSGNARNMLQASSSLQGRWQDDANITLDGLDDVYTTTTGSLPADASVFLAIKTTSAKFLALTRSGTVFFGACDSSSSASPHSASAGSPTYYVNNVLVPGATRQTLQAALATGSWNILEVRNLDLTQYTTLSLGGITGFYLLGAVGRVVIIPTGTQLTDNRAKLLKWLGSPYGLSF